MIVYMFFWHNTAVFNACCGGQVVLLSAVMSASTYLIKTHVLYIKSRHISIFVSLFIDMKNIVSCSWTFVFYLAVAKI